MELRVLKYFLMVAREENFTRAAENIADIAKKYTCNMNLTNIIIHYKIQIKCYILLPTNA